MFSLWAVQLVPDTFWANRLQHAFGGGFMALVVYIFALRDSDISLRIFQAVIFGILIVTALGVGNELLELTLQTFTGVQFTHYLTDTWLDLLSNTVGVLAGAFLLFPWYQRILHK